MDPKKHLITAERQISLTFDMLLGLSEQFWVMCVKLYLREASEVLKKHVEGDVKRDLRSRQIGVAQRKRHL